MAGEESKELKNSLKNISKNTSKNTLKNSSRNSLDNKWKINLALLTLSLITALIILELTLAFLYPQQVLKYQHLNKPTEYHPILGWFNKKNFFEESVNCNKKYVLKTNNFGFRDNEEYTPQKDSSRKRIVVLGDSLIFGEGLDNKELYTTQLRNILGEKYEIWNFGVPGYGTDQEALLLRGIFQDGGKRNWPDIVIVGFFQNDLANLQSLSVGNDSGRGFKPGIDVINGSLVVVNCCPVPKVNVTPVQPHTFFERFHTYILFRERYHAILLKIYPLPKTVYSKQYHESENTMLEDYDFQSDFERLIGITDELRKMAKEHKFKLVFINIPHNIQVDKQVKKDYLAQFSDVNDSSFKIDRLNKLMKSFMDSRPDIIYIDLLQIFEKEGNIPGEKSNIFYPCTRDMHWNALGAKRAAQETAKILKEKRII